MGYGIWALADLSLGAPPGPGTVCLKEGTWGMYEKTPEKRVVSLFFRLATTVCRRRVIVSFPSHAALIHGATRWTPAAWGGVANPGNWLLKAVLCGGPMPQLALARPLSRLCPSFPSEGDISEIAPRCAASWELYGSAASIFPLLSLCVDELSQGKLLCSFVPALLLDMCVLFSPGLVSVLLWTQLWVFKRRSHCVQSTQSGSRHPKAITP